VTHVQEILEMHGISEVFGEDGAEALHVKNLKPRRLMLQMKTPEARHKAHSLYNTVRMYNLLLKRVALPREKWPRIAKPPALPPAPPTPLADASS
jgi:hypothetical protein